MDYARAYGPTWGRARARTLLPVPGNHEYQALNSAGYYNYFGPATGDPTKGYYSLNLATWHIVALTAFLGVCIAVELPVRHAYLLELVGDKQDLPNAVATTSLIWLVASVNEAVLNSSGNRSWREKVYSPFVSFRLMSSE